MSRAIFDKKERKKRKRKRKHPKDANITSRILKF
jgi:hypothetical protein